MRKRFLYGLNNFLAILIFLGIMVFVNLISIKIYKRFDLTKQKLYTLSPQTKNILKNLKQNLEIIGFYQQSSSEKEKAEEIFEQYKTNSNKITYRFIDPDRNPAIAKNYNITSYGTIILKYGEKTEKVYSPEEKEITRAIIKLTKETKKKVYFTKGHGEKSLETDLNILKSSLENEQYEVKEVVLLREGIPSDCDVLVIAGPEIDFLEKEIEIIENFIENGGRILLCIEPGSYPNLEKFLSKLGVVSKNAVVIDLASRKFLGDPTTPMIVNYPYHQITKDFNLACIFSMARPLNKGEKVPADIEITEIAKTSEASWGETDLKLLSEGRVKYDQNDIRGPVCVAVAGQKNSKKDGQKSRFVIIGDSDFLSDKFINLSGNKDFALNSIAWLSEEDILITIREKERENQPLFLTEKQGRLLFYLSVIVIPFLILFYGAFICTKRKLKY